MEISLEIGYIYSRRLNNSPLYNATICKKWCLY